MRVASGPNVIGNQDDIEEDKEEVEVPRRRSPRMKSPDKSPRKSSQGKRSTMRLRKSVRNG